MTGRRAFLGLMGGFIGVMYRPRKPPSTYSSYTAGY